MYPPRHTPTRAERAEVAERARARLARLLTPGSRVYTTVNHAASNGMSRHISLVVPVLVDPDGTPLTGPDAAAGAPGVSPGIFNITAAVGHLLGYRRSERTDGLVVSGAGMDMGFELVYQLSRELWPAGFGCIGPDCPANDHANGDRDRTVHLPGNDAAQHWHRDGGYALRHRWL